MSSSPRARRAHPWTVSSTRGIVTLFTGLLAGIFGVMSVFGLVVVALVEGKSIGLVFGLIWLAVAVVAGTIAISTHRGRSDRPTRHHGRHLE